MATSFYSSEVYVYNACHMLDVIVNSYCAQNANIGPYKTVICKTILNKVLSSFSKGIYHVLLPSNIFHFFRYK